MGRPPVLDQKLVRKIASKKDKPDLLVVKSVSALASRRHISPEVALIITANKYGIGSSSVFKKLSSQQQIQLDTELNNKIGKTSASGGSNFRKKIIKSAPDIRIEFADPYLHDSLYSNIPSEGYSIMFVLENSVRVFITRILSDTFGENWWNDQIKIKKSLKGMVVKVAERKTKDSKNWYHSKRSAHEIYYTDYAELLHIIHVFNLNFARFFQKGAAKNLVGKLEELTPTRNVIAHNNPITSKDLERLRVHTRDWFAYMKYLKLQNS